MTLDDALPGGLGLLLTAIWLANALLSTMGMTRHWRRWQRCRARVALLDQPGFIWPDGRWATWEERAELQGWATDEWHRFVLKCWLMVVSIAFLLARLASAPLAAPEVFRVIGALGFFAILAWLTHWTNVVDAARTERNRQRQGAG